MARADIPYGDKTISYYLDDRLKEKIDTVITPDLNKKDKDCVICIDGFEGCFFEDTTIKTTTGDIKIKDLYTGKPFELYSLDLENDKECINKAMCIKSGIKELFEIETIDGRKVRATANHTFFILRDNKVYEIKLSELKEGDELICQ